MRSGFQSFTVLKGRTMVRIVLALAVWGLMAPSIMAEEVVLAVSGDETVILPAGGVLGLEGPGLSLQLVEIVDNRCPSAADCYWEGLIRAVFRVNNDAHGAQVLVLCNLCDDGSRDGAVPGYVLSLVRMFPDTAQIEALGRAAVVADYTVVFTVAAAH